jgi:RHS repeat-associated protein
VIFAAGEDSYIYGTGSIPIEQVSDEGAVLFYHADQLGSTRMLTDSEGVQKAAYTFDPYGNTVSSNGEVSNPFGYAGAFTDIESGLLYMRARYYNPTTGQFISRDPFFYETREPYAYANDSPINFVDPTGLGSLKSGNFFDRINRIDRKGYDLGINPLVLQSAASLRIKALLDTDGHG